MAPLGPADHALLGACSGTVEVLLMQPTVAMKNAIQEGRAIPSNPLHWYRGVTMNCVSMAPITATQFGANRAYNGLHAAMTGRATMSQGEVLVTGAAAGATSALMANPTELVVVSQQQSGRPLAAEVSHIVRTLGVGSFFHGVQATVVREAIYGCCWMEVMPMLRRTLEDTPAFRDATPEGSAHVASGVVAGLMGACCSQPFDTIKTRMQAFISPSHPRHAAYASLSKATATIAREDGYAAFMSGIVPRAARITCAVFILSACRKELTPVLEQAKDNFWGV